MAVKVTKGQICSGTISKIKCHKEYYLYGKFHTFFTNSTECLIFWTMPLYYVCNFMENIKIYDYSARVGRKLTKFHGYNEITKNHVYFTV